MPKLRELLAQYWLPIHPKVRLGILAVVGGLAAAVIAFASLPSSGQSSQFEPAAPAGDWAPSPATVATVSPGLDAPLLVHVVGQVVAAGVYELPAGSRVIDAVAAAGGFTSKAAQDSVNLARPITDGEQIVVQARGAVSGGLGGTAAPGRLSLNQATAAQLEALPGIGPAIAGRIVDYRNSSGGFKSLSDLAKVAGVGPKLIAAIKDLVTL